MEYDSALTNKLGTVVIHSRSVYSQARSADFGYIPVCKSKNPRGIVASRENVPNSAKAKMTFDFGPDVSKQTLT